MKKVILGVCGGIAAYKTAELARLFIKEGFAVRVVMTEAALKFITPLTFETLTAQPVLVQMFAENAQTAIPHIELAKESALVVIAPATANTIAKMACGLADNLLTTLCLAATCPKVVVPAMNMHMLEHPAVQQNIKKLKEQGCFILEPDKGELACGETGRGRLPEPAQIFQFCRRLLSKKDFQGVKALVTAGPTREALDPVRFLSNPSTGLMGYSLAEALSERGADVLLISGPTNLKTPFGVKRVDVTSAAQMHKAVLQAYKGTQLVIKAAAVSDYRPLKEEAQKVKKDASNLTLELTLNPDILLELGRHKEGRVLVGFAAETQNTVANALEKLKKKNLDLVIANNVKEARAGFGVSTNRVMIIDRAHQAEELPLMKKTDLAHAVLDRIHLLMERQPDA